MTIAAVDMRGWSSLGIWCVVMYLALSFRCRSLPRWLERGLLRDQRPLAL